MLLFSLIVLASAVAAAAAPLIHSIVPATVPAAAIGPDRLPLTITVHGQGFGAAAAELLDMRLLRSAAAPQTSGVTLTDAGTSALRAQSSAMQPDSFACAAFQWVDSSIVECTLPSLQLQANFGYTVQLNVSHALSTVSPSGSASLRVDCLASAMCGFCYLDQPTSGDAFYFERVQSNTQQESVEASILPPGIVLALLILGGLCACILLLLLLCCWRRLCRSSGGVGGGGGKNRVGQRRSTGSALGVIVNGSPNSIPGTPPAPIPVPDGVMISYSHANSEFAHRLEASLTSAGMNVWIDTRIVPGEDWRSNIAEAIELSFAVVFILSPQSVTSRYCKEELYFAAQLNRHLVPIVHEDSWKSLKGGLKMLLQRIQWLDFARDGWDCCFPRLVTNLQTAQKALQDRAAAMAAEDAAARGWGAAAAGGTGDGGSATRHRLRPAQLEMEAGFGFGLGFGGDDLDYEDTVSYRAAPAGEDTLVMMSPRQSNQTLQQRQEQLANLPVLRLRLPELAGEEVSHEASKSDPADVYICVDGSSRSDQSVAESLRSYLSSHGIQVYTSSHPKLHVKAIKGARAGQHGVQHVLINSDGRASPVLMMARPQSAAGLASLKGFSPADHRASPDHSRRPSVAAHAPTQAAGASNVTSPGVDVRSPEPPDYPSEFLSPLSAGSVGSPDSAPLPAHGAWGPQHSPDSGPVPARTLGLGSLRGGGGGGGNGGMFAGVLSGATSPPVNPALESVALSSVSHKRAKSIRALFNEGSFLDATATGPTEDLFELNASRIDASTMMIFIASASSIKSNDCIDELHYSYEVSKPMLAIRNVPVATSSSSNDESENKWHKGLMHGSVGMMLNQVPSVSWETDGQATAEWTALFFAIKHKLQAERMRRRMESSRRSSGGTTLSSPAAKAALASLAAADAAKQSSHPTQSQSTTQTTATTTTTQTTTMTTLCVPPSLNAASSGGDASPSSPPTSARGVLLDGVVSPTARRSSRSVLDGAGVELAPLLVASPIAPLSPAVALPSSSNGGGTGAFQSLPRMHAHVSIDTHSPAAAADAAAAGASNGDGAAIAASPVYSSGSPPLHPGEPVALLPLPPSSTSPVAPSGSSAVLPVSPQPPSASPPAAVPHTTASPLPSPSPPSPQLHQQLHQPHLHSSASSPASPLLPVKHHRSPSSRVPADSPIRTQNAAAIAAATAAAAAAAAGPSSSATAVSSRSGSPVSGMDHSPSHGPAQAPAHVLAPARISVPLGLSPSGPSTPRPMMPAAAGSTGPGSSSAAASSLSALLPKVPSAVAPPSVSVTAASSSSGRARIGTHKPPATLPGMRASRPSSAVSATEASAAATATEAEAAEVSLSK